ncbi:hypothetical protein KORDIASMS9_00847 [Kordia sp. SMS9]|uniref:hypothetical protein n=1 Tax=Kordia sp. SMS9 TaxID=2282170 RepID=UPI000E102EFC|nr:hypothetical protein [Kordia sp. SMS9]AXG68631.1 hypothetical protein KORDIASMS9_00847 [Kordia sp. SMS9]
MKINKKGIKEMQPEKLKVIAGGVKSSDGQTQTNTDSYSARSSSEAEAEGEYGN